MSDVPAENALKQEPENKDETGQAAEPKPEGPSADFAALIHAIKTEGAAYRREEKREDRGKKFREWIAIGVIALTFAAVCYQVYEMVKVYEPIRDQAVAATIQAKASEKAADAAIKQSQNAERAITEGQRAWVGPINAKIEGAVELGKPVKAVIGIQNTGREPGRNFRFIPEPDFATDQDVAVDQRIATALRFCMKTPSLAYGQVIYPSSGFGTGFDFTVEFPGEKIDQPVIDGDKTLVVQGCMTYDTFGMTHHSGFCYFYKNKFSKIERLNICGGGSDAD